MGRKQWFERLRPLVFLEAARAPLSLAVCSEQKCDHQSGDAESGWLLAAASAAWVPLPG